MTPCPSGIPPNGRKERGNLGGEENGKWLVV